jgi:outer membrane protein assembly complex protein YaeT
MRRVLSLGAAALFVLTAAPARADIDDYLGRRITAVDLESDGRRITDARLTGLVQTHVGDPLRVAAVRESVLHLFTLGRYEDIRVLVEARDDAVALTYALVPLRPVTAIDFLGANLPGVSERRLRRLVTDRFGRSPRPNRSDDMARLVEEDLRQVGYLRARVVPRIEASDGPRSTLLFDVTAGPRARIGRIDVTGDAGIPLQELLSRLRLSSGAPYQPEAVAARIAGYLEDRREQGFLAARLTVLPQPTQDPGTVNVVVAVEQGLLVNLVFDGDPLPADRRVELVPIAREGSVDEDLLEDSSLRIEEFLRSQGYRDVTASYTRRENDRELTITYTVRRGPQYRVARVEITGNRAIQTSDIEPRLRVRAGQPLSVAAIDADRSTIQEMYRREGFASVQVESATDRVPGSGDDTVVPVVIRIAITENERTVVNSVTIEGSRQIAEPELRQKLGLQPGRPFYLTQLAIDRDAIQAYYANLGYQSAVVTTRPGISVDGRQADVVFAVTEGPRLFVDHVLIAGNERTKSATIERELKVAPGDPLGLEAINEGQRRLAALGLFRRARITEIGHGDETRRDILVTVEEAPVTTVGYGGGIEAGQRLQQADGTLGERLEFAPRAFFEIGRRNLFGRNRSVNVFTRVSLRPPPPESSASRGFGEYRVIGTFREPRALGTGADAFLTGTLEQQIRTSFNFTRRAFNAELARRVTPRVSVSGSYQIQRTELFHEAIAPADKLLIDRAFPQVRLSSFAVSGIRDTRDDLVDPSSGSVYSTNVQLAARRIGSEVGLAKTYMTAQAFRAVPRTGRVVLALSARLGLATGFPRLVVKSDADGNPEAGSDGRPLMVTVRDLPASERFFTGGDTTVRGFALDQVGAPDTIDKDGLPIGGGGLVIFNAELRVPLRGGFGVVGFFDSGNVFSKTSAIDLGQLRNAVGFGVRYRSPIGPIRVDVGFKAPRQATASGNRESASSLHISLGQAF